VIWEDERRAALDVMIAVERICAGIVFAGTVTLIWANLPF
jgi:hypothetical protein